MSSLSTSKHITWGNFPFWWGACSRAAKNNKLCRGNSIRPAGLPSAKCALLSAPRSKRPKGANDRNSSNSHSLSSGGKDWRKTSRERRGGKARKNEAMMCQVWLLVSSSRGPRESYSAAEKGERGAPRGRWKCRWNPGGSEPGGPDRVTLARDRGGVVLVDWALRAINHPLPPPVPISAAPRSINWPCRAAPPH